MRQLSATAWERVFPDLDACQYPDSQGHRLAMFQPRRYADITGDGIEDAFVEVACSTESAGAPERMYVFDGSSPVTRPKSIGQLPGGLHTTATGPRLRALQATVEKSTVTLRAKQFSDAAPNCCPDLSYTQTFTWNGSRFIAGTAVTKPLP